MCSGLGYEESGGGDDDGTGFGVTESGPSDGYRGVDPIGEDKKGNTSDKRCFLGLIKKILCLLY